MTRSPRPSFAASPASETSAPRFKRSVAPTQHGPTKAYAVETVAEFRARGGDVQQVPSGAANNALLPNAFTLPGVNYQTPKVAR